jgi:hypothetical protein
MSSKNENPIQSLFETRKNETRRIHDQYVNAMEVRTCQEVNGKKLISSILSDFPEDNETLTHNLD